MSVSAELAYDLCLSDKQIQDIRDTFKLFDKNGNGVISIKELAEVLRMLGQNSSKKAVLQILKKVDQDGSGSIEFTEFVVIMASTVKEKNAKEKKINAAFKALDKDGSGYITPNEIHQVLKQVGERLSHKEREDLFRHADVNADGVVSYEGYYIEYLKQVHASYFPKTLMP